MLYKKLFFKKAIFPPQDTLDVFSLMPAGQGMQLRGWVVWALVPSSPPGPLSPLHSLGTFLSACLPTCTLCSLLRHPLGG